MGRESTRHGLTHGRRQARAGLAAVLVDDVAVLTRQVTGDRQAGRGWLARAGRTPVLIGDMTELAVDVAEHRRALAGAGVEHHHAGRVRHAPARVRDSVGAADRRIDIRAGHAALAYVRDSDVVAGRVARVAVRHPVDAADGRVLFGAEAAFGVSLAFAAARPQERWRRDRGQQSGAQDRMDGGRNAPLTRAVAAREVEDTHWTITSGKGRE